MKYAMMDAAGLPLAFYAPEISGAGIPTEAIAIAEEQWRECIANPGRRQIVVAADGTVSLQAYEPPGPSASERRATGRARIDRAAGDARLRFISPGALLDAEYLQAERDAQAYADAGYPAEVPASVQAWADAAGLTAQQAADDILATAAQWRTVLDQIRALRLQGKAAVTAAADADIETTAQSYIDQLDAITP